MNFKANKLAKKCLSTIVIVLLLFSPSLCFAEDNAPTEWDLSHYFDNEEDFNISLEHLNNVLTPSLKTYKNSLSSPQKLLEFLSLYQEASILSDNLYIYASMLTDVETNSSKNQELLSMALSAYSKLSSSVAFMKPELMNLTDQKLHTLASKEEFQPYRSLLLSIISSRPFTLSEESERILALATEFSESPSSIYEQLTLSDAHYGIFLNPLGMEKPFNFDIDTIGFYSHSLEDRINAENAYMSLYSSHANTIASIFIAEVNKNIFLSRSRGYESVFEFATSGAISKEQYDILISSARENVFILQNFYEIKRKALGFDSFNTVDFYLPYATSIYEEKTYDSSISTILKSLAPLGNKYIETLENYLNGSYIDVYSKPYKTSSQYSWGAYGKMPFILLNYEFDFESESTLAHELGHAVHQIYTGQNQYYFDTFVGAFPAEVASTLNELMLLEYYKNNSDENRLYYLEKEIQLFIDTFYTQVMLADFENRVYTLAEKNSPLSLDILNSLWIETASDYFGTAVNLNDSYKYYWMQIPHLYEAYYLYSYPMSIAMAYSIKDSISVGDEIYRNKYIEFLENGAQNSVYEQMKSLGIDLNSSQVYENLFYYLEKLLDEMDSTLEAKGHYEEKPMSYIFYSKEEMIEVYKNYYADQADAVFYFTNEEKETLYIIAILILSTILLLLFLLLLISRKKVKKMTTAAKAPKDMSDPLYHHDPYDN